MGVVGRLDQYASMLAGEFDDYSMSENLLTYSENYSNVFWSKVNLNVGSIPITSPDGNFTSYKLIATSTNSVHQLYCVLSGTINTTYTLSMYVKAAEYSRFGFGPGNAAVGGTDRLVRINLNEINPILSQDAIFNNSAFVTSVGNGWYRIGATWTATSTGTMTLGLLSRLQDNSGADSFSGDGVSGLYIWGAQFEIGSTATDYTPTTTTAINRVLPSTTNTNITGLGTYYSSGFDENVGFTTFLPANISAPYDPVYDEFGGTLFGAGQGRYMRQYTDKSVIVYNEIDEVTPIL